jgi:hypothetical protein
VSFILNVLKPFKNWLVGPLRPLYFCIVKAGITYSQGAKNNHPHQPGWPLLRICGYLVYGKTGLYCLTKKSFVMKKVMMNFRLLAVTAALMAGTTTVQASHPIVGGNKAAVELKWIGNQEASPVFKLVFNNPGIKDYSIVIKDEYKQVLYTERLRGNNLTRLYQLENQGTEDGNATIVFEVTDRSNNTTVVYRVSTATRMELATEVTIAE